MAQKYARIFVRGHYLSLEANSFPRALLSENCSLCGTDNVQGQISERIFAAKLRLLCLLSIGFKNWGISWGIFAHVTRFDQSRVSKNIWWIINTHISTISTLDPHNNELLVDLNSSTGGALHQHIAQVRVTLLLTHEFFNASFLSTA